MSQESLRREASASEQNSEQSAFPLVTSQANGDYQVSDVSSQGGLTKREYLAARAMQGYLAAPRDTLPPQGMNMKDVAVAAVIMADKLLLELSK